jgi:release factor glutamine methyltransferase
MIWTVSAVLQWTSEHFKKNHLPTPRLDAEVLLAHLLKTDRVGVYTHYDRPLDLKERQRFRELVKRRVRHEPVAYITGHREFFSLDFLVEPGVLIPRPETEVLVEKVLELREEFESEKISLLDLGTGCGNIAISLAHLMPHSKITACDISRESIRIAQKNARRLEADFVEFLPGDLFEPVRGRRFDIIVSNPPYITRKEMETLESDIKDFEPQLALDGGEDGLDFYRRLAGESEGYLKNGGYILLEIGACQATAVKDIFATTESIHYRQIKKDYAGYDRVIVGQKD